MREGIKFFKEPFNRAIALIIDDGKHHYTIFKSMHTKRTCIDVNWEDPNLVEITLLEVLMMKDEILDNYINFSECCCDCRHSNI